MRGAPDPGGERIVGSRRRRALLSLLFAFHWGAVASYLLPAGREALEPLPDRMERPAAAVLPAYVRWTWRLARPYLDLTATRQHWTLFAPYPATWSSSVRVVPYFPDSASPGPSVWRADTLVLGAGPDAPYPHLLHHRTYRILYNLGYEAWGRPYRPHFAREMCRAIRTDRGDAPDGVALVAEWRPLVPPWEGEPGREVYRQRLGGYDCPLEDRGPPAPAWPAYGLPPLAPAGEWPAVEARPTGVVGRGDADDAP